MRTGINIPWPVVRDRELVAGWLIHNVDIDLVPGIIVVGLG